MLESLVCWRGGVNFMGGMCLRPPSLVSLVLSSSSAGVVMWILMLFRGRGLGCSLSFFFPRLRDQELIIPKKLFVENNRQNVLSYVMPGDHSCRCMRYDLCSFRPASPSSSLLIQASPLALSLASLAARQRAQNQTSRPPPPLPPSERLLSVAAARMAAFLRRTRSATACLAPSHTAAASSVKSAGTSGMFSAWAAAEWAAMAAAMRRYSERARATTSLGWGQAEVGDEGGGVVVVVC